MSVAGADGAPSGASNAISVSARTTRVIFRLTTTAFGFLAFAFLALARAAGFLGALRFGAFARLAVFFAAFFFFRAVIEMLPVSRRARDKDGGSPVFYATGTKDQNLIRARLSSETAFWPVWPA